MIQINRIVRFSFLLMLMAQNGLASSSEAEAKKEPLVIRVAEVHKDIKVPSKIWDLISAQSNVRNADTSNVFFVPIKVHMTEKNPNVIHDSDVILEFQKGGGQIDLAKFVTGQSGTFHISFEFEGFDFPDQLQVYYVSQARKRRIDGEIYGTGCNKFMDLTKSLILFKKKEKNLLLNTSRNRHVTTIGGHFIFAYKKDKQSFVSQVTFFDSKHPDLFCSATESKSGS